MRTSWLLKVFAYWRIQILAYLAAIPVIAVGWHFLAPRAECYFNEGKCVWQMDQTSSPYFFADLTFAAIVTVIALILGWFFARKLQSSLKAQLMFAGFGYLVGFAAAKLGESWNHVEMLQEPYAIDALRLRSTAMFFLWPLLVQMFVVFRERVQTTDVLVPESDSAGEGAISN